MEKLLGEKVMKAKVVLMLALVLFVSGCINEIDGRGRGDSAKDTNKSPFDFDRLNDANIPADEPLAEWESDRNEAVAVDSNNEVQSFVRIYTWNYPYPDGTTRKKKLVIPQETYFYYKDANREAGIEKFITNSEPAIEELAAYFYQTAAAEKYLGIIAAVQFAQQLASIPDESAGSDGYLRYPVETLVDKTADNHDAVVLAAALLKAMGNEVVIVKFSDGHLGVAIYCDICSGRKYEYRGLKYYYYEVSNPDWTWGELPLQYRDEEPEIVNV